MGLLIKNESNYSEGEVFYYRSKNRLFGGVFLFRQQGYYLIAISEEISKSIHSICVEDVLHSPLYTIAWFSDIDLLLPKRIHKIGTIPIDEDYSNRAGLLIDGDGVYLRNVGQRATWKHEYCSFTLHDANIMDVLSNKYVPKTWR